MASDAETAPNPIIDALQQAQGVLHDTAPIDPAEPAIRDTDQGESEGDQSPPPTEGEASKAESLFLQAREKLEQASTQSVTAIRLLRKCTKDIYDAGGILLEAQRLLKADRGWRASLKRSGIAHNTAWEAIELYRRTGDDTERIFAMSPTKAKKALGIYKNRVNQNEGFETGESTDADSDKSGLERSGQPRRSPTPKSATTRNAKPDASQSEVTLPPSPTDTFVLTDAEHDAVTKFVEAIGGWNRAAQVFQAAWKLSHDQEQEGNHGA